MHPLIGDLSALTTDEVLKKLDALHKQLSFSRNTGNAAMMNQIINVIQDYQAEYDKRRMAEVKAAEQNPIFKDSLDIG
jgi:hypothetical protein